MQNGELIAGIAVVAVACLLLGLALASRMRKRRNTGSTTMSIPPRSHFDAALTTEGIGAVVIGQSAQAPALRIQPLATLEKFDQGTVLDLRSAPISRLGALIQAVPNLLLANEAAGKRLMEVVINGDLVRAADGNGMRAFAMNAKGIGEHARLFDAGHLQNVINAAAVWQVASVLVAQKHLADISAKLDEIKDAITNISGFLDQQRRSRIEAAHDYLIQAHRAISAGELPPSVRLQLEQLDVDLVEIHRHLAQQCHSRITRKVEHKEFIGTEDLTADIGAKIGDMDQLAADMRLCLQTRILSWHVLSLYPGEPQLKLARRASIEEAVSGYMKLAEFSRTQVGEEISKVSSSFNRESTLKARRAILQASWT